MAVRDIVTMGFGSFSSVYHIPVLGYLAGDVIDGALLCGSISVQAALSGRTSVSQALVGDVSITPALSGTAEVEKCG